MGGNDEYNSLQENQPGNQKIGNISSLKYNSNLLSNNSNNVNTMGKTKHDTEEENENINEGSEVKDLKNKMKIIMNKLNTTKREKENLSKENRVLQQEIIQLQSNLRQMISGFSNTSSSFPMLNELAVQTAEFYKYDCLDLFFDILCPELNMKGILYFFSTSFSRLNEEITSYLQPALSDIMRIGCFESIEGPITNVLRKSYQTNYQQIYENCISKDIITQITNEIQHHLQLGGLTESTFEQISSYIKKLGELLFFFHISDPPLAFDPQSIGTRVMFNGLRHDPFDGFIKAQEQCIIVLPSVYKANNPDGELSAKALVLQVNYEIPN